MKIYLGGPDVFLENAIEIGQKKEDLCAQYGFEGLFPIDNKVDTKGKTLPEVGFEIYRGNIGLMDRADCIIANLTPYQSVNCDAGTAFEMGYMRGLGKPIYGYSNVAENFLTRQKNAFPHYLDGSGHYRDKKTHMAFESFDLADNLMLAGAVQEQSSHPIFVPKYTDDDILKTNMRLDVFEMVLKYMAG